MQPHHTRGYNPLERPHEYLCETLVKLLDISSPEDRNDQYRQKRHAIVTLLNRLTPEQLDRPCSTDIDATHHDTLLCLASRIGYLQVVERLVTLGADIEIENKFGMRPLTIACRKGHVDCARLLLGRGAQTEPIDKLDDRTALHGACAEGTIECVRALVEHGADVRARCCHGTAAELAERRERHAIAAFVRCVAEAGGSERFLRIERRWPLVRCRALARQRRATLSVDGANSPLRLLWKLCCPTRIGGDGDAAAAGDSAELPPWSLVPITGALPEYLVRKVVGFL